MNTSRKKTGVVFLLAILFSVGIIYSASAQEKEIKKDQLPPAVIKSFQKAYPNAQIKGTDEEIENGITYYEVESVDGKIKRDLLLTKDGKIVEIEEGITASQLPHTVQKSLKKKFPGVKVEKAEMVTRGSKVQYELVIEYGEKKAEVVISGGGKILKIKNYGEEKDNDKEGSD